jgi:hypothetical protein
MVAILDHVLSGLVIGVGALALILGTIVAGFGVANRRRSARRPAQGWANY